MKIFLSLVLIFSTLRGYCSEQRLDALIADLKAFYEERDWDQFHSPKNLVMDLAAETGELAEPFRWLTEEQSKNLDEKALQDVKGEIGDLFKCLIYLSYKLGIDPVEATYEKLEIMKKRFPVEACRGKALKYTAYEK
jgi:NTP pyrophosphatase (non-canonical NTP hydrolase)